jgi:DNA-directed RNA polymerase specialized sigma24 family protein
MKIKKLLTNEAYVALLAAQQYNELIELCDDYIREKVEMYLRSFPYHYQYRQDYLQEVLIHILTKSLPSKAFLQACENGNSFKFYLAKSVRNILNTLLTREKTKRQSTIALENLNFNSDEPSANDKSVFLSDKTSRNQTDFQDLWQHLQKQFELFLQKYQETLPRIAFKLILMLKLHARAPIYASDLKACFPEISPFDMQQFWAKLGGDEVYRQREDLEIYELVYPFFQIYRQEKGTPAALQRWVNQYISGDKASKGILDYLTIDDNGEEIKITDKKMFADFMFAYFKNQPEETPAVAPKTNHLLNLAKIPLLKAVWLRV